MHPRSVLLAALACVTFAACGGGGSSPSTHSSSGAPSSASTTTGVTKASYIEQANTICTDMNAQVRAATSRSSDPTVQASSVDHLIAITQTALRRLRALPAPPGDAETLSTVYADVDRALSDSGELASALHASNIDDARRIIQTLAKTTRTANDAANAYGLTACGATT